MKSQALFALAQTLLWLSLSAPPALADREADRLYEQAVRGHGAVSVSEQFARYARAAESGHAVAQYNIAMMYANGEAVNVDYQQAAYWFLKSANQRFAPAQHRLGELRYFGMGGPEACMNLAMMSGSGDVVPLDTPRAIDLLECAENGAHELAAEYRAMLTASPDGRFSRAQSELFWNRQRQYWVDMAAQFGVRDAEEAVSGGSRVP